MGMWHVRLGLYLVIFTFSLLYIVHVCVEDGERFPVLDLPSELPHAEPYYQSVYQRSEPIQESRGLQSRDILLVRGSTRQWRVALGNRSRLDVPFDVFFVSIEVVVAFAESTQITINQDVGNNTNYTLGLGENKIDISVMNEQRSERYRVAVVRHERTTPEGNHLAAQTCRIVQDCDLRLYSSMDCGLKMLNKSWWSTLQHLRHKPSCAFTKHHSIGRWLVPCKSCDHEESCWWKHSIWDLIECNNMQEDISEHASLEGKQILFLGDSTNRGMLHSLIHMLNGSLSYAPKSHGFLSYKDIRGADLIFQYYPHFWKEEQPSLDTVLKDMLSSWKSQDGRNIYIVIGGVQWLTVSELKQVDKLITSHKLLPHHVIIKSYSSGFHFRVPGLLCHNQSAWLHLIKQNEAVVNTAIALGFRVVDTFQMTLSRYKEFHQGKCACHFHEIQDCASSLRNSRDATSCQFDARGSVSGHVVNGHINRVYTGMLLETLSKE